VSLNKCHINAIKEDLNKWWVVRDSNAGPTD
jgi:hypothetical protein